MKQTITEDEFIRAFDDYNRSENFTVAARRAMFEYFEEYEEDTGVEMDLDVIAICCEFSSMPMKKKSARLTGLKKMTKSKTIRTLSPSILSTHPLLAH